MSAIDFCLTEKTPELSTLYQALHHTYRAPEPELVERLLRARADFDRPADRVAIEELALHLARSLREREAARGRSGLVQALLQEFALSSQEGVALMCLAEALLRIPDQATRDALILDKIKGADWWAHVGQSDSLFVNAASWGLLITGQLLVTKDESGLAASLKRLVRVGGDPLIRRAMEIAMRMMGAQFVSGETIAEALHNGQPQEAKGFRYSYDMLGEAALTATQAQDYGRAYENAIHAIGQAAKGQGVYRAAGISIKLSALHPRYQRSQRARVKRELWPVLLRLVELARHYDIGINIDAEEADRLALSLDLLTALCEAPSLQGWDGIGFVVQAYQKRACVVLDFLQALAERTGHRLMVRLVKGAYWDTEIKRAQVEGLNGYPVFTRKCYTDLSYLVCAQKLLQAPTAFYPQFATHNAHTVAAIVHLAGPHYQPSQYEFQCLHGMGEALYEPLQSGAAGLTRPCRIYAPVGSHETLLAYLVRRLLENGANSSFVHRLADEQVTLAELVRNPCEEIATLAQSEGQVGLPHPAIPLPLHLFQQAYRDAGARVNSLGLDLSDELPLRALAQQMTQHGAQIWQAAPLSASAASHPDKVAPPNPIEVRNPADRRDLMGRVVYAEPYEVASALDSAAQTAAASMTASNDAIQYARQQMSECLLRAADFLQNDPEALVLLVREAGKSYPNASAEIREAVDFLRFYALEAKHLGSAKPLGVVICISPWNFPLAIFVGQIAAALAAGNTVLAKPAEQTPLIAHHAVSLLHRAGVPRAALQCLPGLGHTVGAQLMADARVGGVLFTGSIEVARLLQQQLAGRLNPSGQAIPLIAETGGQNALIVDSSALLEQVVSDVMSSAFDSAGQRCSALRLLCVQADIAPRLLTMLEGAMAELALGDPRQLAVDVGPLIDEEARQKVTTHIQALRGAGLRVRSAARTEEAVLAQGTFVAPTLIELTSLDQLQQEIFGPVLHVLTYQAGALTALLEAINGLGYGLTLGLHTRIHTLMETVSSQARVGNLYINRNMVGAVVGVQPFGGEGLSGTGPKAGGPLYLPRLVQSAGGEKVINAISPASINPALAAVQRLGVKTEAPLDAALRRADLHTLSAYASAQGLGRVVASCERYQQELSRLGLTVLPGPTGESNVYTLSARAPIACLTEDKESALMQLAAVIAVGGQACWPLGVQAVLAALPSTLQRYCVCRADPLVGLEVGAEAAPHVVLHHGSAAAAQALTQRCAAGSAAQALVLVHCFAVGEGPIPLEKLLQERVISINTSASGGNAALMMVG